MVKIAPSILAADFTRLGDEVRRIEQAGADLLHVDVMDGHFVPNISMGPFVVEAVRRVTDMFLDVHLMIEYPEKYIRQFVSAGADNITVHLESHTEGGLDALFGLIRACGARRGVSVKPATPVSELRPLAEKIDLLLIMSVEPGFGGQKFMKDALGRIREARKLFGPRVEIEVDGGIGTSNAADVVHAGADIIVAGTSVFKAPDPAAAIRLMKGNA